MELAKNLQQWFAIFGRRSVQDFMRFAHESHLSMPQIMILMRLYYSGPSTILNLRKELTGSRASATLMIDELVKKGWVERSESAEDRRVKAVKLTDSGRQLVENGISARRKWMGELADTFSDEQKIEINRVLELMISGVQKLEKDNSEKQNN